jgi:DegV family protein with EDD domain
MQIVGDTAADVFPGQMEGLPVHLVPLTFTLDGVTYKSGEDVDAAGFYRMISATSGYPVTSQPPVGAFVEMYRRLAATDPEILSIHVDSVLSGTYNSAVAAAQLVPEAHITHYDSKTLASPLAWLLEAAARAGQAGWSVQQILDLLGKIRQATSVVFTVSDLDYLVHGGRISHMKGLLARALKIKPLIGIDTTTGIVYPAAQARTMRRALEAMVSFVARQHAPGSVLRMQVLYGAHPELAETLRGLLSAQFECCWLPEGAVAPVLGAHTGPGVVAAFYAPAAVFDEVPGRMWQG